MAESKVKKEFSDMPKEIQMEIIKAALPDAIEIVAYNSSGRYRLKWQEPWIAELRLVSREFSQVATDKIARASHCYFHEARELDEIPVGASSLPGPSVRRIDKFPGFILQACTRLIIIQSRTGVALPSDLLDVSAFPKLKSVGLDISATSEMLNALHWFTYKLTRSAEEQVVGPLLAALRKLFAGVTSIRPVAVNYDYLSHSFFGVLPYMPHLGVNLEDTINLLCGRDEDFGHNLMKLIGSEVLGLSRASVRGLNDDALFEAQFWAINKSGEYVKLGTMDIGATPDETFTCNAPRAPRKKGWEVVEEDDAASGRG